MMEKLNLQRFESVRKLMGEMNLLTRSDNTIKTYLTALKKFCEFNKIENLDELIEKAKKGFIEINLLIKNFLINLVNKNIAPKTIKSWYSGIKKFFFVNELEVKNITIKSFNVHEDYLPSKVEIKKILEACDLRCKTIILILLSSGIRIDELRNLKLGDISLEKDPCKIRIRGYKAKERKPRITFISNEARNFLLKYLEKRKKFEEINENSFLIATKEGKQMSLQNLEYILNRVFRKFSKKEGKRWKLHPHVFRKFFKTQLIASGIPGPIVDRLVGHSRYLASEYELYNEEQLAEWYKKGELSLTILD